MIFEELLLKIAVSAVFADGKVDKREIKAIRKAEQESYYFKKVDLKEVKNNFNQIEENNLLNTRSERINEKDLQKFNTQSIEVLKEAKRELQEKAKVEKKEDNG